MMRGDKKWPPEQTKQQMVDDEEEQKKIAQGPAFKPKKVPKVVMNIWWFDLKLFKLLRHSQDYTQFFGQHKLNAAFPGYKVKLIIKLPTNILQSFASKFSLFRFFFSYF